MLGAQWIYGRSAGFFFVAFVKGKNMGKCAYIAEVCFNI